jgi:ACS family sodium-dependent inorganic phosphate cotransporter
LATLSSHIPEQPWVAQSLLMGTVGLQAFNAAGYVVANQEKAGQKWTGLLYSITSLPGVMFGSFGVYVTGKILDYTQQDWSIIFGLNSVVNVVGASAFVLFYNSKREFE